MHDLREKIIMVLIVAAFFVGSGWAFVHFAHPFDPPGLRVDPETHCVVDGTLPAHTVIVFDQSNSFEQRDHDWFETILREETRLLPEGGMLSLYSIAENPAANAPVFTLCSPGGDIDWANENSRRALSRYDAFIEDAARHAGETTTLTTSATTPLLETILDLADRPQFTPDVPRRRLIIISDMMQNTANYDFYRDIPEIDRLIDADAEILEADFSNVCVMAKMVRRAATAERRRRLKDFWENYFAETGTELYWVRRLTSGLCPLSIDSSQ